MKTKFLTTIILAYFILISFTGGFNYQNPNDTIPNSIDFTGIGQGIPYFSFFSSNNFASKDIFSIIEDEKGQILLANRRGIIIYDAKTYNLITTPGMPVKLAKDPITKEIYVACNNSFGKLKATDNFTGKIDIFFDSNDIYFDYRSFIGILTKSDETIKKTYPPIGEAFGGFVKINGKSSALLIGKGFFNISENILTGQAYSFEGQEITVHLSNKNFNLFITEENKLYYIEDDEFIEKDISSLDYLQDKIIIGGVVTDDYLIALYTLNGGIAFFDVQKEKIISVLNNFTGLPENEVLTMTIDKNGGLWIANNFGLFRYDLALPILNYGIYPGIEGKIISSHLLDTSLYVLTTKGLYYLTKPSSDAEFEDYVEKQQTQAIIQQTAYQSVSTDDVNSNDDDIVNINSNNNTQTDDQNATDDGKRDNIFKRWSRKIFNKKNNDNNQTNNDTISSNIQLDTLVFQTDTTINSDTVQQTIAQPQYIYVPVITTQSKKKQFSELYYIFKKVDGIDTKTKQIVEFNKKLYVSTNSGLYSITDNISQKIIKNEYVTTIQQSIKTGNILYVATISALYKIDMNNNNIEPKKILDLSTIDDYVFSISESDSALWLGGEGFAYRIKQDSTQIEMFPISPDFLPIVKLLNLNNNLFCYTPQGIYKQNKGLDSITIYHQLKSDDAKSVFFIKSQKDIIWYKQANQWKYQTTNYDIDSAQITYLNIIDGIIDIKIDNDNNLWVVSENNSLYKISSKSDNEISFYFNLEIKNFTINNNGYTNDSIIKIKYSENLVAKIGLMAPFYLQKSKTLFQYAITSEENSHKKWTELSLNNKFEIPLIKGTQFIHFRSKNSLNQFSNIKTYKVIVKPPFKDTILFNLLVIFSIISIISIIAFLRQKALKNRNDMLEYQVQIRTARIEKQNEELKVQSEEIQNQSNIVQNQNQKIQKTNHYITQSINYARRIQKAILPTEKTLLKHFSDYFIISKPKDIVSGDFYWTKEQNGKIHLAVADCTGHGVPGAFLSMLGTAFLNEITTYKQNLNPALILNSLRQSIIFALQEKEENTIRDGMDISFATFDFSNNTINFAGAYHSLYLLREGEIHIHRGDRMPIGFSRKNDIKFSNKTIKFKKDDIVYFFSDGYPDQFGGKHNFKFMLKNFRKILKTVGDVPLSMQKELLNEAFDEWKGKNRQIDDVTIVAVKL